MNEKLLRDIATEFLIPFFSGSTLERTARESGPEELLVSLIDENRIAFKVSTSDDYKIVLYRRQPFSEEVDVVPETSVVEAFVHVLTEMSEALNGPLRRDLLSTFQRRVVAKAVAAIEDDEEILLVAIDQLSAWSNRLYEGSPISAAIGLRNKHVSTTTSTFKDFGNGDFGAIFSNGHDTLLEFNFSGEFLGHAPLRPGAPAPYCPYRQTPVAVWTTKAERRVALTLNRLGEILVLRDQRLLFARRSGRWSFLTHRPIITQMGTTLNRKIRRAVYTSCLDASFARTGACIGIINSTEISRANDVVSTDDFLIDGDTIKILALKKIIDGRRFQELDRRLRQELLALDGAMVLTDDGEIIAAGAILKIPGGSTGGGRLAAAKALGAIGLGIKVSQDGGITGFRRGRDAAAFRLM